MSELQERPPASYSYKPSLIGSPHRFELSDDGLCWHLAGRSGVWRYADIAAVRLSFRPVSMQRHRFRADLRHRDGGRLQILSTSWQTAALMVAQDQSFRDFIVELHARMASADSRAMLTAGLGRTSYAAALALLAILSVAMTGLLVRAIAMGEALGALFILGFAALFVWQIGGFIHRNQPRSYDFRHLPPAVLP